jgi:alpha-mannosidase
MLIAPKTLEKLRRIETTYHGLVHEPFLTAACSLWETDEHRRAVPAGEASWTPCPRGTEWGKAWGSAWFRTSVRLTPEQARRPVYVIARTGGVEALFWLDGVPAGLFNFDPWIKNRGDHRAQLVAQAPEAGRTYELAFESYAGNPTEGSQPYESAASQNQYPMPFTRRFDGVLLCHRNEDIEAFVLDLRALNQLSSALPLDSFRKGEVDAALAQVFAVVVQDPARVARSQWESALVRARAIMRPLLEKRNGDSAPVAGIIGHSHMDTAWHWTMDETIRKCARTYANALRLMEQYPEYRFVQSSAQHAEWMRLHYPPIFADIQRRVAEGRWEPNGGGWIEPDVNLAGGEALIRQFLAGQAFTRKHFGYTSDTFWLPDTFGYPAALPQILRGCGLRYFATTKLTWNETNTFPYDTFWWEGIDGSRVFTHFPDIHCAPDPETLINKLHGTGPKDFRVVQNCVRHKDVNQRRLLAYGYGDGGGGPDPQMIEMARRCRDLEGCPRAEHTTVGAFMKGLEQHAANAPVYVGELYLEAHRGTLTQMHEIKRLNRRAEFALREAEFALVLACLGEGRHRSRSGDVPSGLDQTTVGGPDRGGSGPSRIEDLWRTLLVNQFHDILPGTSIAEVHDRAIAELRGVVEEARAVTASALSVPESGSVTVLNALSWQRDEAMLDGLPPGRRSRVLPASRLSRRGAGAASPRTGSGCHRFPHEVSSSRRNQRRVSTPRSRGMGRFCARRIW